MPLLLLYGSPLSGKSLAAREVERLARGEGHDVRLLTDESVGFTPRSLVTQPGAVHARLKQQVSQFLSKDRLVIVDFVNCTKSFRYELFCIARERGTRNCILAPTGASRGAFAGNSWRCPSREEYAKIVSAHASLLENPRPSGQLSTAGGPPDADPPRMLPVPNLGTGWTYESYTDICSRLEPLLPDQKADNPLFLFPAEVAEWNADGTAGTSTTLGTALSNSCKAALDYLYPLQGNDEGRKRGKGRQEAREGSFAGQSASSNVGGSQQKSTAPEEELLRRVTPILADYLL